MKKTNYIHIGSFLVACLLTLAIIPGVAHAAEDDAVSSGQIIVENGVLDRELPDNRELFAQYVQREFYGIGRALEGNPARNRLNSAEKAVYDALKPKIEAVASKGGSTQFVLNDISGLKMSWTNTELGVYNISESDVKKAVESMFAPYNIFTALLEDFPFEMYWFDKTQGYSAGYNITIYPTNGVYSYATISDLTFVFKVSQDYSDGENFVSTDVSRVTKAKNNATQLVAAQEGKTPYAQMVAYKNYICEAVEYDDAAAENIYTPYGDPWQLISVFDGDSATNVVCEGYSKAFQYLCDLSGIDCISATGDLSSAYSYGGHMWNVVSLDGGIYLVDITNSDTGTAGQAGGLFLVGGSYRNGRYSYTLGYQTVSFICDDLKLSADDYTPQQSGWYLSNGKWYYNENGTTLKNAWKKDSGGWCYLGSDGAMVTKKWIQTDGKWYYVGTDGHRRFDCWREDSAGWCYLGSDGAMVTNKWIQTDGKWYYVDSNGYMLKSCWRKIGAYEYYFYADGHMAANERIGIYWVDANGRYVHGK